MFEHFLLIRIIIHGIGFDIGFGGFFLIVRIAVFIRRQLLDQFDGTAFITRACAMISICRSSNAGFDCTHK